VGRARGEKWSVSRARSEKYVLLPLPHLSTATKSAQAVRVAQNNFLCGVAESRVECINFDRIFIDCFRYWESHFAIHAPINQQKFVQK
jgi:hypothetical protein